MFDVAQKKNLTGMNLPQLQEFVGTLGEPTFRGKQVFDWLYTKGASSFNEMTSLSKAFRSKLEDVAIVRRLRLADAQESRLDGTIKLLFELSDGNRIESVLIPSEPADEGEAASTLTRKRPRRTLCVSTQIGCPLDCAFCATASMGFVRNLTAGEIVDQILEARRLSRQRITNLVYMGMGEPLMNYDNLMQSIDIVTTGMGMSARRITVSTAGWADRIRRMADEGRKVKLAVSLHALDPRVRTDLMPINRKFPLERLLDAIEYYYRKTKQRVTYEYIPFDGVNDSKEDADRLAKLAGRVPCKVNIVPFHTIGYTQPRGFAASLKPASPQRFNAFIERLRTAHVTVIVRSNAGEDIEAACGQLAVLYPTRSRIAFA